VSDPLAVEVFPVPLEPAFVCYLTWRSSGPITEADLDLLVGRLEKADPEVCLQMPNDEEPDFVVSLGSMATGYFEAAAESVTLLLAATAALEINAELIEAEVCSEDGQARFDCAELVQGLGS
jgi:hypothetical protein